MSIFFEGRKKKGLAWKWNFWSLYSSLNTWELSLPTARPLKEPAFAFRIQKGRTTIVPLIVGEALKARQGLEGTGLCTPVPQGLRSMLLGSLAPPPSHDPSPPPPGIHSCLHWGDCNFCSLMFKRSLKAYKKALKISWTPNASYRTIFWWVKCKWIRNLCIKFPLT